MSDGEFEDISETNPFTANLNCSSDPNVPHRVPPVPHLPQFKPTHANSMNNNLKSQITVDQQNQTETKIEKTKALGKKLKPIKYYCCTKSGLKRHRTRKKHATTMPPCTSNLLYIHTTIRTLKIL